MVLPPSLVEKGNSTQLSTVGFVEVLDFLTTSAGFQITGMKMVQLSLSTAGALHTMCGDSNDGTKVGKHLTMYISVRMGAGWGEGAYQYTVTSSSYGI